MKAILNFKFKKDIQKTLNNLFFDEEYHEYTLGELLKIIAVNILILIFMVLVSCMN